MRITALQPLPGKRIAVHLDGGPPVTLSTDVCFQFGLRTGGDLTGSRVAELQAAEARQSALASALRLLAYGPRTEGEMRDRLARKGIAADVVDATTARLRELRLLDDEAFSRSWAESRDQASPRSRRLIASELRVKRISRDVAETSAAAIDEEDAARRASARRAQTLKDLPWPDFRRRLGDFLLRRGFDREIAASAVAQAWNNVNRGRSLRGEDEE